MASHIEIIDAMCGTGKTHAIITWMKQNPEKRYLYISPMKSEVEHRIPVRDCSELDFKYPETNETYKTKTESLLALLEEGHNVAFTHSLYSRMTPKHIEHVKNIGYTIIIDEEMTLIEPLSIASEDDKGYTDEDIRYLYKDGKITIDEEDFGRVVWSWDDYGWNGQYSKLKSMCDLAMVYCTKSLIEDSGEYKMGSLVVELPISLIEVAERCIAISYLFKGSVMDMFLNMKGIDTEPFNFEQEQTELRYNNKTIKSEVRDKITFINTLATNKVGKKKLSYSWYEKEFDKDDAKMVAAAIRSVARICDAHQDYVMWTLPKSRAVRQRKNSLIVEPRGYGAAKCYVYCGCRATNEYQKRHTVIHALYRHPNVTVRSYLQHYGYDVDPDNFALAEMIQWIWRSRIRHKEPINLCILSRRMQILFERWLFSDD